jgi:hypothetical protein
MMKDEGALVIDGHAREVAAAFDYSVLPPAVADKARRLATQIRSNQELQVLAVLEVGRDLAGIKDELGHGHFGAWLKAEFNMTDRTARRYMQAAEEFGDKSDTVSVLTLGELHQLVAAPDGVKQIIVQKLEAGERPNEFEIRDLVKAEKEAEEVAKADAKLTPDQRRRRKAKAERDQREWERNRQERDEVDRQRRTALDEAAVLIVARMPEESERLVGLLEVAWQTDLSRALRALGP